MSNFAASGRLMGPKLAPFAGKAYLVAIPS